MRDSIRGKIFNPDPTIKIGRESPLESAKIIKLLRQLAMKDFLIKNLKAQVKEARVFARRVDKLEKKMSRLERRS